MTQSKPKKERRKINLTCNPTEYGEEMVFLGHNKEQDVYVLILKKGEAESLFCGIGQDLTQLEAADKIGSSGNTELYLIGSKQLRIDRNQPAHATINRCAFRPISLIGKKR